MSLSPGTRLGPYEIVDALGSGAMGDVFRARDTRLQRAVAIKTISPALQSQPGFAERFDREAQAIAALSHPNIVTLYDVGNHAGHRFMVMELLEGETLQQLMVRGAVTLDRTLDVGIQIADALAAAHAVGLVHRDVKPANIFVTSNGTAKLMDFGVAKPSADAHSATAAAVTRPGELVGTVSYMSPEQAKGLSIDARSDVFSLGAVLYEMAADEPPFGGSGTLEILIAITTAVPASLSERRPGFPPGFSAIIERALTKDVAQRPRAADLGEALRAIRRPSDAERKLAPMSAQVDSVPLVAVPATLTRLIGRDQDVADVVALLRDTHVRLVNCTGPGGVGKTRLAIAVARAAIGQFRDGVAFVSLEAIRHPEAVEFELTKALQLREGHIGGARRTLVEFLRDKAFLLVIDNFEHVVGAVSVLTDLLRECPFLKCLVTSRAVLNVQAEHQFYVQPLGIRGRDTSEDSAVALFLDRARVVQPDIDAGAQAIATIAEICRRLDGLPLAIELAAARTRLLSPSQLLARIDKRLQVLGSSSRDLPERQRTLRGAIDWSYQLLGDADRLLFVRCAVFRGGATLDSVEAVCEGDVLDSLEVLTGNHLLQRVADREGNLRFSMLEGIRDYAGELLEASGESETVRLRYATHYLTLAERADRRLCSTVHAASLDELEAEYANCRCAIDWFVASGRLEDALRLSLALWRFWEMRGYWTEGRLQLERLLATAADGASLSLRAGALYAAGVLADAQCDFVGARRLFEQHLSIQRGYADPRALASAVNNLGVVAMRQGDYQAAERYHSETLAIVRSCGLSASEAASLNNLGHVALALGDYARARANYEASLRISQTLGDLRAVAWTLSNLADIAVEDGQMDDAELRYSQGLNLFRQVGDKSGQASCMADLGNIAQLKEDLTLAASLYQESLVLFAELGDKRGLVRAVEGFARLAAARKSAAHTLRLAAVAHALRGSLGMEAAAPRQSNLVSAVDSARREAGSRAELWWAEGIAMPIENALQYALESAVS